MTQRHALARATFGLLLLLAIGLSGCSQSHVPMGEGVCCPVTSFSGCSPGSELPGGGWAPSEADCTYTIGGFDGPPWIHVTDERGCERVEEDYSVMSCGAVGDAGPPVDAGPPPPWDGGPIFVDAGATGCDGLGPAACLQAGCMPTFDDSCCPSCTPSGGCADCVHWTYYRCQPPGLACSGESCSGTPPWGCASAPPDCSDAHVNSEDACDIAGCVPAYPSGMGEPDPSTATCAPIHAEVCTTFCRRLPPPCPARTVAEGDGSCYTNRCIPAFVCE